MPSLTIKALKVGGVPSANTIANDEHLLVLTPDGAVSLPKADAMALFGGGGGSAGGIDTWDVAASEALVAFDVLPFTELWRAGSGLAALMRVPAVTGSPNKTVTKLAPGANGGYLASYYIPGGLSRVPGQYWLHWRLDLSQANTQHTLVVTPNEFGHPQDPASGICHINVSQTELALSAPGVTTVSFPITTPTTATDVVLMFDTQFNQISAFTSAAPEDTALLSLTDQLVGMHLCGTILGVDEATVTATLNATSDTGLPIDVSAWDGPIQMISAPLPDGAAPGRVMTAVTSGCFINRNVTGGESYYLGENNSLVTFLTSAGFVRTDVANQFGTAQYIKAMSIDIIGGDIWIGDKTLPAYALFKAGALQGSMIGGAFGKITSGGGNCGIGRAFSNLLDSSSNTAMGDSAGTGLRGSSNFNAAFGYNSMTPNVANSCVAVGGAALQVTGYNVAASVAIGPFALTNHSDPLTPTSDETAILTPAADLIAIGSNSMSGGLLGSQNIAIGTAALSGGLHTAIDYVTAVGDSAAGQITGTHLRTAAFGSRALYGATNSLESVAVGHAAGQGSDGNQNVMIGYRAFADCQPASNNNTAVGTQALSGFGSVVENSSALGWNAAVTGSNQVQLGNSATTAYAFGAVQDRSDPRDKADDRDTVLGLDFVLATRPVDFRWDMRSDYIDLKGRPVQPPDLRPAPSKPTLTLADPKYHDAYNDYEQDFAAWEQEVDAHSIATNAYREELAAWVERNKLANIVRDGSKKRTRFHHGFLAPELRDAAVAVGAEFGGFQDHSLTGGDDVQSVGYGELIAPSYRAIQQLHEIMHSEAFIDLLADKIAARMAAGSSE